MRPGQNKRMRGRPNNNGGGHRKGPNPLTRSYESNGPDVKIRGNAHHVAEKYLQLARDAQSSGDPVAAESYLQHAEHYFRLIASAQAAQAGLNRQPDAVDDVDDSDEDALPDRFASPQAATPFVPQQQPYAGNGQTAERQPYAQNGGGGGERPQYENRQNGERQPYGDRQGGGERQPYADRQNGERQPYGDRNAYGRQDRNNNNRRPYRDNNGGEVRTDDRQNGDRSYGDRQNRRERFSRDGGQERPYGDRTYDRPREDRFRDAQPAEQPRDAGLAEQPRFEPVQEHQPSYAPPEPTPQPEAVAAYEPAFPAEPVQARVEAPSRRRERAAPVTEDAPGLPSFITAPPRATPTPEAAASGEAPSLTTATPFPGDDAAETPKFPRRRRRTTRAVAADGEAPEASPPASVD